MHALSVQPQGRRRGHELLLDHCTSLTGSTAARPPASARLEASLGSDLARLLVSALGNRHGVRRAA